MTFNILQNQVSNLKEKFYRCGRVSNWKFFLFILFRVGVFTLSLHWSSIFSSTWNLGLLLGLSYVSVLKQAPDLQIVTQSIHLLNSCYPRMYWAHAVTKFCLQGSWITGVSQYAQITLHNLISWLDFVTQKFQASFNNDIKTFSEHCYPIQTFKT